MPYFSEREFGDLPRDREKIGKNAWGGIRALIKSRVEDGSFGASHPENCDDGPIVIGTDATMLRDTMRSHVRGLSLWPWADSAKKPSTPAILDLIEFCWTCIGKPISQGYHSFGSHNHLRFDQEAGREKFRTEIETIFRRNGIAYQLTEEGRIERLAYPVLREAIANQHFDTGDSDLDGLLNKSIFKFLDPDPGTRRETLDHLWDAWERLKTLKGPGDKKALTKAMLKATAGPDSPKFGEALDKDAIGLTWVGNNLRIRKSETDKEKLARSEHVDYLFHRMFSLIQMILRLR